MMHCHTVRERFEEAGSDPQVAMHLQQCPECNSMAIAHRRLRGAMRQMPKLQPPAKLTVQLRVAASQERARANNTAISWLERVRMSMREMMRPLAVPALGGLTSAIILFSALMPAVATPVAEITDDVPLMLVTEPSVKNFPAIGIVGESELVVDVDIDGAGRMVEYNVVRGAGLLKEDANLKSQLENSLLFTEFTPATKFGGPASGRVRLRIKSSQITIRG